MNHESIVEELLWALQPSDGLQTMKVILLTLTDLLSLVGTLKHTDSSSSFMYAKKCMYMPWVYNKKVDEYMMWMYTEHAIDIAQRFHIRLQTGRGYLDWSP